MTTNAKEKFKRKIWEYYNNNKREFPWRNTTDPYKILVSEVMLQQTQTSRVIPKYEAFLERFPDVKSLAIASNEDVLRLWSGLGYNRRALYLKRAAEIMSKDYHDQVPLDPAILQTLPGIGTNTAGAIYVFSTNKPHVFIETNVRRVFIHEFFKDQAEVLDKDILKLIGQILDQKEPREFYYGLMDYGAYLGKSQTNPNRKSKHYTKQSTFEGSVRQVRGQILKILLAEGKIQLTDLEHQFEDKEKLKKAIKQLEEEGFISNTTNILFIKPSIGRAS